MTPRCYKDLEQNFFTTSITETAFSLYNVSQGSWGSIMVSIKNKTKGIHDRIWAKGRRMRRNPLDNKYEPDPAAELLRNELYDIFHAACRENFVTSDANIRAMFDYIEYRQASRIRACFGRDTFIPKKEDEEKP